MTRLTNILCCMIFPEYCAAFETVTAAYADRPRWLKMAAMNTAGAGFFSADRTIAEYNKLIWRLGSL